MSIIEQVYTAAVLWLAGLDKFPLTIGTTVMVVMPFYLNIFNINYYKKLIRGKYDYNKQTRHELWCLG